jgi:hypothetical protein
LQPKSSLLLVEIEEDAPGYVRVKFETEKTIFESVGANLV